MRFLGPFKLHEHIRNDEEEYELFFDWDESFADRGLVLTKITESNGEPGNVEVLTLSRDECKVLFEYLNGCLKFRKHPGN